MKFNDRELMSISQRTVPTLSGHLTHQKPSSNDWSEWVMNQSGQFKERFFKLHANMLFYYRIGEASMENAQPLGVIILENAVLSAANSARRVAFEFTLSFPDEPERRHVFGAKSEADRDCWINALRAASCEFLRRQLMIIEKKLAMRLGDEYATCNAITAAKRLDWRKRATGAFTCHIDECPSSPKPVELNLIDL